jgi:hypothetical protein
MKLGVPVHVMDMFYHAGSSLTSSLDPSFDDSAYRLAKELHRDHPERNNIFRYLQKQKAIR